jgi:hypothetical protein
VALTTTDHGDHPADLLPLVDQAIANTGKKHENVAADSGFCDYAVLQEVSEKREENFLVPDKQMEADKKAATEDGKFKSGMFTRQEDGSVICPNSTAMKLKTVHQEDNHSVKVFAGVGCSECPLRARCTKGAERTITVDSREPFRDEMRAKLNSDIGREEYRRRQHVIEPVHGHEQFNHGWRMHHLRGMAKAAAEFILMRTVLNIEKIIRFRPREVYAFS